jgi:hypothetical protein
LYDLRLAEYELNCNPSHDALKATLNEWLVNQGEGVVSSLG